VTVTAPTLNPDLLARYGTLPIPRYTSYPPANLWAEQSETFARSVLEKAGRRPASLYIHVPFCHKLCFYCGCNMLVTHNQRLVERYLDAVEKEMASFARALAGRPEIVQIHLGGRSSRIVVAQQLPPCDAPR
jgi:oxygen-independent coproporphyrinogen-3 oxidase